MKYTIKVSMTMLIIIMSGIYGFSQKHGVGGAIIYNFQTNSIGLDLRTDLPLKNIDFLEGISLVPQLAYFPSFNKVHEFYIGSSVHLGVYTMKTLKRKTQNFLTSGLKVDLGLPQKNVYGLLWNSVIM
jgi:hypothetical protein